MNAPLNPTEFDQIVQTVDGAEEAHGSHGRIREIPEVCNIFCATANPVEVILAETEQGRGILGVVDGSPPKGIESTNDREWRHGLLRKIGYKR